MSRTARRPAKGLVTAAVAISLVTATSAAACASASSAAPAAHPTPAKAATTAAPSTPLATTTTTGRALPTKDPFYRYTGKTALRKIAPGTVLKKRTVKVSLGGSASSPVTATQLLYRTVNEKKKPVVTVTTVIPATKASTTPSVVAYLSFYDALGAECDPSYTLAGGSPGSSNSQQASEEELLISSYLTTGATVEIPDYENEKLHWAAGQESGWSTLDSIRATESFLKAAPTTTPVGLTGYSGGSIAADWASELAPKYAPSLHLVGVAEGGIPVDFAHNLKYINGSKTWSGVIPAVLVSTSRAFGFKLSRYLSPKGRTITKQVKNECIGSFNGAYPGLTIQSLLKKKYRNFTKQPVFARILNRGLMGTAPGHPLEPLDMVVGNADGTGDDIMVAADVQALAHEYCEQGTPVTFTEEKGDDHEAAAVPFELKAVPFLFSRLLGTSFKSEACSKIGKGNSLKPLPVR